MLEDIERETQHPDYKVLGVSVLVIMTHGAENFLYGRDGRPIKMTDIFDLMSPYRFQSMAGNLRLLSYRPVLVVSLYGGVEFLLILSYYYDSNVVMC